MYIEDYGLKICRLGKKSTKRQNVKGSTTSLCNVCMSRTF